MGMIQRKSRKVRKRRSKSFRTTASSSQQPEQFWGKKLRKKNQFSKWQISTMNRAGFASSKAQALVHPKKTWPWDRWRSSRPAFLIRMSQKKMSRGLKTMQFPKKKTRLMKHSTGLCSHSISLTKRLKFPKVTKLKHRLWKSKTTSIISLSPMIRSLDHHLKAPTLVLKWLEKVRPRAHQQSSTMLRARRLCRIHKISK